MKLLTIAVAAMAAFSVAPTPTPLVPQQWNIDGVHSSVVFKVKHANASWFYGAFGEVKGSVVLPDDASQAKIEVVIPVASVDTRNADRDKHLKGPDFFDAKQFPELRFASTKVAKDGDALVVDGSLTMRGVTKPVSVRVQKTGEGEFMGKRVGFETSFTVKRSDYGMDYGVAKNVLGDEVTLMVSLECTLPETKGK